MAQLSRPFQIALAGLCLLVLVWVLALRGHSSSTSGYRSPASARAAPAAAQARSAAAPSYVYTGPAPGVSGLTKAIAKAHEAVASSQRNASQLQEASARASSANAPAGAAEASAPAATGRSASAAPAAGARGGASAVRSAGASGGQRTVEAELRQGKIVLLLFWNPNGADDAAVHGELRLLAAVHALAANAAGGRLRSRSAAALASPIAVHEAPASGVASFGSITRGVQVSQTPTLLVINRKGRAAVLTGLTDAYAIQQAIEEARHA